MTQSSRSGSEADLDVVIVGAGMAGLYAYWRLLEAGFPPDRTTLFEADGRVGGRVLTLRPPQDAGLALDMGAHNYSASHRTVGALVGRFGLKTVSGMGAARPGMVNLRGRSLSTAEIARSWFRRPFAYDLSAYVQRRGPARIMRKALEKMPRGSDGKRRSPGGRPLADCTLPDALLEVMTADELSYVADRLIYSIWRQPVQAEAALSWIASEVFRGKGGMTELPDGMAQLPDALVGAIAARGGKIELGQRLVALDLPGAGADPIVLRLQSGGARRTVKAGRVILALPADPIGQVEGLAGRPQLEALRKTLIPQRAVVTALVYPQPWWSDLGIDGASVTDMTARHLRSHGGEPWRAQPGAGALLSYSDGANADFWQTLSDDGTRSGWISADHPVAAELHRQVEAIFGGRAGKAVPAPAGAFMQNWNEAGGGAAFHMWAAGCRPDQSMNAALHPIDGQNLHLCGEAWSLRQGWIEGALETVDALLDNHFRQPFQVAR